MDSQNQDQNQIQNQLKNVDLGSLPAGAHIHLIGVCGTAMGSLAGLLKSRGFHVTGSDQNIYPPMSDFLRKHNIPCYQGFSASHLEPRPDLVIIGNVITKSNPEAQRALELQLPYTSLAKALGEAVIGDRQSVVVAGTHGKTTTTALLALMAERSGLNPGFMVGGVPLDFAETFRWPEKNLFVIEGDEYDTAFFDKGPKFLHYRPHAVLLSSIEFDHADIYQDLEAVKLSFKRLLQLLPEDGVLVFNAEDKNIAEILSACRARTKISYGLDRGDYSTPKGRVTLAGRNHISVFKAGKRDVELALKVFGAHNTLNALGALALSQALGWNLNSCLQALADFRGVKRRQEVLGQVAGVTVIEDFAHHPTAVALTIDSMRERFPGQRVLAVFEPRSATSRRRVFQNEYVRSLAKADLVFVTEPYDQTKINELERFSVAELVRDLRQGGTPTEVRNQGQDLVQPILEAARTGDILLVMSNGAFDGIYNSLLQGLAKGS